MYVQWDSRRERKEQKKYWSNNSWRLPKFDEKHCTDPGSLTNSKNKCQEIYTEISSKNAKSQRQEENLKNRKRKLTYHLEGKLSKINSWLLIRNNGREHIQWKKRQPIIVYPAKLSFKEQKQNEEIST